MIRMARAGLTDMGIPTSWHILMISMSNAQRSRWSEPNTTAAVSLVNSLKPACGQANRRHNRWGRPSGGRWVRREANAPVSSQHYRPHVIMLSINEWSIYYQYIINVTISYQTFDQYLNTFVPAFDRHLITFDQYPNEWPTFDQHINIWLLYIWSTCQNMINNIYQHLHLTNIHISKLYT